jgi:uncharacterized membrane protein YphA (DoxX/SURF4 family)
MRIIGTTFRIIVGLLFMFSGFVKFNDPLGFSYKMEEYFDVFAQDLSVKQDSIYIQIEDAFGNQYSEVLPGNINIKTKKVQVTANPAQEFINIGEDTFAGLEVYVSIDNNLVFNETHLFERDIIKSTDLNIKWHVGDYAAVLQSVPIASNTTTVDEVILEVGQFNKEESSYSLFFKWIGKYALWIGMFICIFELVLGYALLIGWKPVPVTWLMLLMILFFTFLTWYSATYNKVTDCGCFGDAIKLTPWQSFSKDVILLFMILVLFFRRKHIKSIFSPKFAYKSVLIIFLLSASYSIYALMYMPPINFLNYKEGNSINELRKVPEGENESDIIEMIFIYEKNGEHKEFTMDNIPSKEDGWNFVDRQDKLIKPAYKPKIHDFNNLIHPDFGDITNMILNQDGYQLILVVKDLNQAHEKGMKKAIEISKKWVLEDKLPFWGISSSSSVELDEFHATSGAPFKFASADNTLVKSIIRSNPGLILLKKDKVIKTWPARNMPSYKQIKRKSKK